MCHWFWFVNRCLEEEIAAGSSAAHGDIVGHQKSCVTEATGGERLGPVEPGLGDGVVLGDHVGELTTGDTSPPCQDKGAAHLNGGGANHVPGKVTTSPG